MFNHECAVRDQTGVAGWGGPEQCSTYSPEEWLDVTEMNQRGMGRITQL